MTSPSLADATESLAQCAERFLPRLLTQLCRDPNSTMHGCCDRDWWHYRIRDFPSIILQQGGYTVWLAARLPSWKKHQAAMEELSRASCHFWAQRAARHGAFEEYYPWEQGYPPMAFSTLAVAKLVLAGAVETRHVLPGLRVAAAALLRRFEPQAANQQVAGLAALGALRKISPELVPNDPFEQITTATLALQHEEGWYTEYDGPDLGYLSVTLDCLWDLYDFTGDVRFLVSARKALAFMAVFIEANQRGAGMHNARNTDYIVPYGIARFACAGQDSSQRIAAWMCARHYADAASPSHPFCAVDDRYISHYIGHSIVRTLLLFRDSLPPVESRDAPVTGPHYFPGSGHVLRNLSGKRLIVSLKKGGILSLTDDAREFHDFGWMISGADQSLVTHWWSQSWEISHTEGLLSVEGALFPHQERLSTPFKHFLLRIASFTLGKNLIGLLKRVLIFKKSGGKLRFRREIDLSSSAELVIVDRLTGLPATAQIQPAPRSSKRHVASADSYHRQDFNLADFAIETSNQREGDQWTHTTRVKLQ